MYSYHDRVSYSRIDKDGLLGVSDTVNAMWTAACFTARTSDILP